MSFKMMEKKYIFLLFFVFITFFKLSSQEYDPYTYQDIENKRTLSEEVFWGGGFGLQYGESLVLKLTPEIGYRLTPKVEIGFGAYYMYAKNFYYHVSDNVYGGKLFTRLFVYNDIFLLGEYEMLNIADYDIYTYYYTGERVFIPGLIAGLGYRQKLGQRSAFLSSVAYNFSMSEKTPYRNPIIRFTFIF